jgi:hypothetical protein
MKKRGYVVPRLSRKRQHRDQLERQAWESFDAQIMRWWDEVLLPRIRFYRRPH